ncbi:MAG TPA: cytochrome P450 [Dehalococcoidia bacterium]|nr:cytochrome P450 [Dehalococcoidia bacterium]
MNRIMRALLRTVLVQLPLARERMESGVAYNPLSTKMHSDPYPIYRKLREKSPIHRSRLINGWILTRHRDVDAVLRDSKRFSNDERNGTNVQFSPYADEARSMLRIDPPDHTRMRSLVGKAFTPRAVAELKPRVEEIVDELLAGLGDSFDVLDDFAYPLPIIVIAEMLGVPPEDRDRFKGWSSDVAQMLEPGTSGDDAMQAGRSRTELTLYLSDIVEARRVAPQTDLISALIAAEEEGDKLTREELLSTLILLLVAGNETTKNLIGNGLRTLIQCPKLSQQLRDNPDLMDAAIEELLRFDSPVQLDRRIALEDVEIGGQKIRKGQSILLLIGAANHDPDEFDDPSRLDFARTGQSHISFGRGIHHCLGAPLARLEAKIAFRKILERFSDIQFDRPPVFKDHIVLRGLESLPVRVRRRRITESV